MKTLHKKKKKTTGKHIATLNFFLYELVFIYVNHNIFPTILQHTTKRNE